LIDSLIDLLGWYDSKGGAGGGGWMDDYGTPRKKFFVL
jgi:hypothetical protein